MGNGRRLVCALSALLVACGGAAAPVTSRSQGCGEPYPGDEHSLQVRLAAERAGTRRALCPGHALDGADSLWVSVELASASFVRMVYVAPSGETGELMRQDAADFAREAHFRAPEGLMTAAFGDAQLVIVASRAPLREADPMLASMLDVIHETGVVVERDGTLTPPSRRAAPGPEAQLFNLGNEALFADFDAHGVAVLTLNLRTSP
jgi:hypothetical protein